MIFALPLEYLKGNCKTFTNKNIMYRNKLE